MECQIGDDTLTLQTGFESYLYSLHFPVINHAEKNFDVAAFVALNKIVQVRWSSCLRKAYYSWAGNIFLYYAKNDTIHCYVDVYIYTSGTLSAHCQRIIGPLSVHYRHIIGALTAHYSRTVGAPSTHYRCTNDTLSAHYRHIIRALLAHFWHTISALIEQLPKRFLVIFL